MHRARLERPSSLHVLFWASVLVWGSGEHVFWAFLAVETLNPKRMGFTVGRFGLRAPLSPENYGRFRNMILNLGKFRVGSRVAKNKDFCDRLQSCAESQRRSPSTPMAQTRSLEVGFRV